MTLIISVGILHLYIVTIMIHVAICLTLSDPGYLKKFTILGGGDFKSPPPLRSQKLFHHRHHIIHVHFIRCLTVVPVEILKKMCFSLFYSDFKIKSIEIRCKNDIFAILSKMDFKYTKRRR